MRKNVLVKARQTVRFMQRLCYVPGQKTIRPTAGEDVTQLIQEPMEAQVHLKWSLVDGLEPRFTGESLSGTINRVRVQSNDPPSQCGPRIRSLGIAHYSNGLCRK
jgi:hypothetical protein